MPPVEESLETSSSVNETHPDSGYNSAAQQAVQAVSSKSFLPSQLNSTLQLIKQCMTVVTHSVTQFTARRQRTANRKRKKNVGPQGARSRPRTRPIPILDCESSELDLGIFVGALSLFQSLFCFVRILPDIWHAFGIRRMRFPMPSSHSASLAFVPELGQAGRECRCCERVVDLFPSSAGGVPVLNRTQSP